MKKVVKQNSHNEVATKINHIKRQVSTLVYEEGRIEYLNKIYDKYRDVYCFPSEPRPIELSLDDHELHQIVIAIKQIIDGKKSEIKDIEKDLLNDGKGNTDTNNQGQ